jgi:hypothetical protein
MMNKRDIQKEVGSLNRLINELSLDLVVEKRRKAKSSTKNELVKEMEEALCELRQARGLSNLLSALDQRSAIAWGRKNGCGLSH